MNKFYQMHTTYIHSIGNLYNRYFALRFVGVERQGSDQASKRPYSFNKIKTGSKTKLNPLVYMKLYFKVKVKSGINYYMYILVSGISFPVPSLELESTRFRCLKRHCSTLEQIIYTQDPCQQYKSKFPFGLVLNWSSDLHKTSCK